MLSSKTARITELSANLENITRERAQIQAESSKTTAELREQLQLLQDQLQESARYARTGSLLESMSDF